MPQNLCLAYIARSAQMAAHVHKHEFVAEHYFVSRMRMSTDDIELNDVEVIQFFEAQAGQIMSRFAIAQRHIWITRLGFSGILRHQQQHQSRDATQRHHPVAVARLIFVTFFPWTPKTFHIQDWFCSELVIFVKYRFPASIASVGSLWGQGLRLLDDLPERNGRIKRHAWHSDRCRCTRSSAGFLV